MSTKKYILNEAGEPRQCEDIMTWGNWFEKADRRVALDLIGEGKDQYCISTVFLGIDYGWGWKTNPIVWETMVFKSGEGIWFDRCGGSREQALAMHDKVKKEAEDAHDKLLNECSRVTHML